MNTHKRVLACLSLVLFVFLGGPAAYPLPAQAAAPRKDLPSFHYVFAHQYLPRSLYAEPQLGLALAFLENSQELLLSMWNHCRENAPELKRGGDPAGLAVKGRMIADNTALAVITMPEPQVTPEAYYACVITTFTVGDDGSPRAGDIAYYTLEKSIRLDFASSGKNATAKAEAVPTVIGGWDKDHRHSNYGPGPGPESSEEFVEAVLKLYTNGAEAK